MQFLGSNALNTQQTQAINAGSMAQRGGHRSAIGMTDKLPLRDQMPNLSPQQLILHWIRQVGQAKSLPFLEA